MRAKIPDIHAVIDRAISISGLSEETQGSPSRSEAFRRRRSTLTTISHRASSIARYGSTRMRNSLGEAAAAAAAEKAEKADSEEATVLAAAELGSAAAMGGERGGDGGGGGGAPPNGLGSGPPVSPRVAEVLADLCVGMYDPHGSLWPGSAPSHGQQGL